MLSNCGHDERWCYTGGMAGDQNGTEWQIMPYYDYPWNVMIRHPNPTIRHWMGDQARAAALNNFVGYDQGQRGTFWVNLADSDYDAAQITVMCEADCSSGVLSIAKAAGYHFDIPEMQSINQWGTTWTEPEILEAAGFEIHREGKYLRSGVYLDNGDILLNTNYHTAFNITRGDLCDAQQYANYPSQPVNMSGLYYQGHAQTYAWLEQVRDGQWCGTKGQAKRLEALSINPPEGLELEVDVHMKDLGWKTVKGIVHGNKKIIGTTGESRRIESLRIRCVKNETGKKIYLQGHQQTYGDTAIVGENVVCGVTGASKRLEAVRIWLQ